MRLPRTSRSAVPSCSAVTTASRPRPPTITRSPTTGARPSRRRRRGRLRLDGSRNRFDDGVDAPRARRARRAGVAGRDRLPRRLLGDRVGLGLQLGDDVVDLAARLPDLRSRAPRSAAGGTSPRAGAAPLRAARIRALGGLERLALARGEPLLVLERAHVVVDLRQVLGELRLARAQVLARGARRSPGSARGAPAISSARLRPGDP